MVTGRLTGSDTNKMSPLCGPASHVWAGESGSDAHAGLPGFALLQGGVPAAHLTLTWRHGSQPELLGSTAGSMVSLQYLDVAFHSLL